MGFRKGITVCGLRGCRVVWECVDVVVGAGDKLC